MPDNHLRIKTSEKRQILVVDDEVVNRELLGLILSGDYSVLFAENGEEALEQIREHGDNLSLILLDLLMPVMSGMDFLKLKKEQPEWAGIPIIVMTADHESEVASLELGAMDFIPKPYPQQDVILARIRRIIELSEDRQIIHSTERDTLTGLYNREFFYNYAESFDHHHRDDPMDAIVLDINHFHLINERYGRMYADQILQQIGLNLLEMVQNSGGIVCRREADTFMVYCPHNDRYADILKTAAAGLIESGDSSNRIRLRMGVYPEVDKSLSMEQRFDRAKVAADTVRSNYTQNIAMYDVSLHEREMFSEQLTEDFDKAIREKQFKVFYQPKFDIRPDRPMLASAEALVRWQHPDLGLVNPGIFIPLFEENGMIQRLDHYVWEEAAAQIRAWKDAYDVTVPVSVNVSRVDMSDSGIVSTFRELLEQYRLEPEDLILEITESAYAEDDGYIVSVVNMLRMLGLRVEMDDFGTGYSSLGMISQLPIDALKLDMIFVRNAFAGHGDMKMIELIIDIAAYLRVPVVAEGVETKEQVEVLKEMGCDLIQGYYFSRPVPAQEFAGFVEEKKQMLAEEAVRAEMTDPEVIAQAEAVMQDSITYARIAQALAADYFSIYYVDTETDAFFEFTAHDAYEDLGIEKEGKDFFNLSRRNILRVIYQEDQRNFLNVFTKENVMQKIRENGAFTVTYRLMFNGVPNYVSLKATPMKGSNLRHIVVGVNNIHAEMQRKKETVTYASISEALAADYFSIYYVNMENEHFIEYSSHQEYEALNIEKGGEHFFETSRTNILRVMYQEDQKDFLEIFTRENLMKELDEHGSFTISYRLVFNGKPTWVSMKATRMMDPADPHIVIGVNNIDMQIRRQERYEQELKSARIAALRDPLTGVKSKRAFTDKEKEINELIAEGEQEPFAIAVCDLNGLKEINDTLGHKAGDQYIRAACRTICNQFKHSPVFRIGGDEFAVILQGADYENREMLLEQFSEKNDGSIKKGDVVIACGMSIWDSEAKELVEAVFERADANMYENKEKLKAMSRD